ncbi:MAG: hypothetical protein IJ507_01240 [Clostridia bacterium]|nr:hypothetical protein [Clostridia bacterium]
MSATGWIILAAAAAVCTLYILRDRRERRRQKDMVMYLRQSDLYAHLYPTVRKLEQMYVESVAVRREEVKVSLYRPAGKKLRYTFEKHGFDPVEDERLLALAQAIGVDLPILRDKKRYEFIVHEDERASGGKAAWYEYMIRTEFKDDMSRAHYLHNKR